MKPSHAKLPFLLFVVLVLAAMVLAGWTWDAAGTSAATQSFML